MSHEKQIKKEIIRFDHVTKSFGNDMYGLDDVDFTINEGDFVFLIGASGAGKTTLMKHIVKEDVPTSGTVYVDGQNVSQLKSKEVPLLRRKVGFIFQDFKLLNSKTAFENVALSLEVVGKPDAEINTIVPNLLQLVGLGDKANRFPQGLSGGEKQKLAIARALAHEPKIILADEPTGNLDITSTWTVVDLMKKINKWGTTIIFGTHDTDIVNTLKQRVIKLDKGKIVSDKVGGKYE